MRRHASRASIESSANKLADVIFSVNFVRNRLGKRVHLASMKGTRSVNLNNVIFGKVPSPRTRKRALHKVYGLVEGFAGRRVYSVSLESKLSEEFRLKLGGYSEQRREADERKQAAKLASGLGRSSLGCKKKA